MIIVQSKTSAQDRRSSTAVVFLGRESGGKSQLIASLSGAASHEANFRGSTVTVDRYRWDDLDLIDTPGIHRQSDSRTTKMALEALQKDERVVLVVQGTSLDDDLTEMLPLVRGRTGCIVVTFWDKVQAGEAATEAIEKIERAIEVPVIAVDGRRLNPMQRERLRAILEGEASPFSQDQLGFRIGWRVEPKPGWMEHRFLGPWLAVGWLLLPALGCIFVANAVAERLHPIVAKVLEPLTAWVDAILPNWLAYVFTGTLGDFGYGLLNMGPFLLVWALPTVLLFSLTLAVYKTTGLIERLNAALHPWSRQIGLSGRDLVRVVMGFGCNVPAVIGTRACSSCSRGTAVAAIAFGSACSYQLPATLAVLAAASKRYGWHPWFLPPAFLAYLLVTTVVYLRFTSPPSSRSSLNLLMHPQRPFLQWPTPRGLLREVTGTIRQFLFTALPVFVLICVVASTMAWLGWMQALARWLAPAMSLVNLPAEAAFPVIMASIRKDGIFLFAGAEGLSMPLNPVQTLTAVYLAGVLLPCIVTALTIARETSVRQTGLMLLRQAGFAGGFAAILAWGGAWLLHSF